MSNYLDNLDAFRRSYGPDPVQLRQRMLDNDSEPEFSDVEIMSILEGMDDDTRWRALQLLPDETIARLFGSNK
jgi:hypothetical protein